MILAIDPGLKPGAAVLDAAGAVIRVSHRLQDIEQWARELLPAGAPWPVCATEGQWYYGNSRTPRARTGVRVRRGTGPDVNDLLKLAFRAGFALASIPAVRRLRIPPQEWRGGNSATKVQVQNRITATLTAPERVLFNSIPAARHGDVLDAIGIGRFVCSTAIHSTTWDWK